MSQPATDRDWPANFVQSEHRKFPSLDCYGHGDYATHIFDQNSSNVQFYGKKNYKKRRHVGNLLFWMRNSHLNSVNPSVMSANCQNQWRHQPCQKQTHSIGPYTKCYKPWRYIPPPYVNLKMTHFHTILVLALSYRLSHELSLKSQFDRQPCHQTPQDITYSP